MDQAHQDYFSIISKYAPVAMAILDRDFRYLSVTKKWLDLFEQDESIIGKRHLDFFPQPFNECVERNEDVLQGKEVNFFQQEFIKKDGSSTYLKWEFRPWYDGQQDRSRKGVVIVCEDTSRRKDIEEALLESEQRFRVIFDQTAIGLALVSLAGQITSANVKACEVFGYPKEELLKKTFQEITYEEDLQKDLELLTRLSKGEIPTYSIEKRYIRQDKSISWAYLSVSAVKDLSGKPLYFISAVYDISLRKKAEAALQEAKAELESKVQERTRYLTLLQKISSEANSSNDICSTLHTSLREICNITKWQIGHFYPVHPTTSSKVVAEDLWCLDDEKIFKPFVDATKSATEEELKLIQNVIIAGKPFWKNDIFEDKKLLRSQSGLKVGIKGGLAFPVIVQKEVVAVMEFFSTKNIAPSNELIELLSQVGVQLGRLLERQKSQEEIQKSQSRLQAIIDNIPARIYLKGSDGKYLIVNKVFETYFRFKKEDLIGKTAYDFFPRDQADKWTKFDDVVLRTGQMVAFEVTHKRTPEEHTRTFLLTKFAVKDAEQEIFGLGGISFDITDEKKTDKKMMRLLKSEHAARTEAENAIHGRDEFISIASHELKSPITAIKMKLQLLIRQIEKNMGNLDMQKLMNSMEKMDKEADRLVVLINRLLDITKIQSGKLDLNIESVNLSEVIQGIIESHSPQLEASKCQLETDIDPDIIGMWDRSRIEQVIVNLLTNAIKFGNQKPIKIIVKSEAGVAKISVKDCGKGIAPEFKEKIFERFERGDVSEGIQGLGLGLYIVRQILEAHGGHISVESKPGDGSTFIVELPEHQASQTGPIISSKPDVHPH